MSSMYVWVGNHLLLTPLIFLNRIKKKHGPSAEFLCTHFCHQRFFPHIIDIPLSSLLLFPFFWFFLFFCLFPLDLWPEGQLLLLFCFSIPGFVAKMKWKLKLTGFLFENCFLNPTIYWLLDVLYVRKRYQCWTKFLKC